MAGGRRDGGQHDAVLVLLGVGNAQFAKLRNQHSPQFQLAGRTGIIWRIWPAVVSICT